MGLRQEKGLLVSGSLSHPSYLAHYFVVDRILALGLEAE